jgi:aminoglycoside phosphotransferase (APT) family kinase protein
MKIVIRFTVFLFISCSSLESEESAVSLKEMEIVQSKIEGIPALKKYKKNKISMEKMAGWSNITYSISPNKNKKFVMRIPKKARQN